MQRNMDNWMEWLTKGNFLRLLAVGVVLLCVVLFLLWLFVVIYESFVNKR